MSHNLRPRRHGPPSDHSYANHIPGVPIYDLHVTPIISGLTWPSLSPTDVPARALSPLVQPSLTPTDAPVLSGLTTQASQTPAEEPDMDWPPLQLEHVEKESCDSEFEKTPIKLEVKDELEIKDEIKCLALSTKPRKRRRKRKAYYDFGLRMPKRKPKVVSAALGSAGQQCATSASAAVAPKVSVCDHERSDDTANDASSPEKCNGLCTIKTELDCVSPSPDTICALGHNESEADKEHKKTVRNKGVCTSCGKQWKRKKNEPHMEYVEGACDSEFNLCNYRRQSERLYIKNYKLPFEELPVECKLMVFSYLSPVERATAGLVCQDWNQLISMSCVWAHVDLTIFNPSLITPYRPGSQQKHSGLRYTEYKERMVKYLNYLRGMKPVLKSLKFKFDIGYLLDDWMYHVCSLVHQSSSQGMTRLICDWSVTPTQPGNEQFCCIFNKIRSMFRRHQHRLGIFHQLMKELSTLAPRLTTIHFPFDWSPRSVLLLCRFKDLQVLKLGKYLNLRGLDQSLLDTLLTNLPELRQLELAICMPLFSNKTLYKISHDKLQTLDIIHCQGFFLREVRLPQMTQFKVFRQYWRGVLATQADNQIPCLYEVLSSGAPKLDHINKHKLPSFWTTFLYDELDHALYRVCSCKTHTFRRQ